MTSHSCLLPYWILVLQGTGQIQSVFVEAMIKEAGSEKDAQLWQSILRSVLSTLKEVSFTDTAGLQSKLLALDMFLRSPMLQKLLVRRLVSHHCTLHS